MSQACKCDRCGEYYSPYENRDLYYTIKKHKYKKIMFGTDFYYDWEITDMDLCPVCQTELKVWICLKQKG